MSGSETKAAFSPYRTAAPTIGPALQRLRSKSFDIYMVAWTSLFAPAVAALLLFGRPPGPTRAFSRLWARGALKGLGWIVGLRYVERFRQHIPKEPCLIVANHQSQWETIAFLILVPNVAIVAKQELLAIPIVGWFLRHSPMIIIERERGGNAIRIMLEESRAALAAGRSVLVFPEGTRKSSNAPVEFQRGIELLYAKLNATVLPVAVDSGRFWGADHPYKRRGTITVSYLDPIAPGLTGAEFARRAEGALQAAISAR